MSREKLGLRTVLYEPELMQRILEVRYTDMEEEKRLCKELLDKSEERQYLYGSAFANTYLVDSHLALGEYSSCGFYLLRASLLCRENGFDDLLLILCNCAGLYYQKLNDDQAAITYFLEGVKLAEQFNDSSLAGKLYNNIGYLLWTRGDREMARMYFELAYKTMEPYLADESIRYAVNCYLSNIAQVCKYLGDDSGSLQALKLCEEMMEDSAYSRIRLGTSWCSYYTMVNDRRRCAQEADKMLASDLLDMEDTFFICDMVVGLCDDMLSIDDKKRANKFLDILQELEYDASLNLKYRILLLKIRYWEQYGGEDQLADAYKDYYEIIKQMNVIEDETRAQSMISRIQIKQAMQKHENMLKQTKKLENTSQLDELTGLYNRRYFNKLNSKIVHREELKTLGYIMADVDYFKEYNDFYGHFKGDAALRTVARVLTENAKEGIYVSRYGGDEFACLCFNLEDWEIEEYIKQVASALKKEKIPHANHLTSDVLTISMGFSNEAVGMGEDTEKLLDLADQALFEVKEKERGGFARKRYSVH